MRTFYFLSIVGLLPVLALGQNSTSLDGKWSASFQGAGGGNREAEMVVTGATGLWRDLARGNQAKNNKCLGKEFPVTFLTQSAAEVVFEVKASAVMQGCPDLTVTAKPVDGKTIEGVIKDGGSIKLVRQ